MKDDDLTHLIIGLAMKVHRTLGHGFLESVYQNSFSHELKKSGMTVECEVPIKVFYDGIDVGVFYVDILVNRKIILEIKAVDQLAPVHEVQLVNYLSATNHDVGLIINFGAPSLQWKKKFRTYRKSDSDSSNPSPIVSNPVNPEKSC